MMEMEKSPFLPLPEGLLIEQVQQTESQLTVIVISTRASASCPGCGCPSEHIHSQYQRTVNDVPCAGRNVVLRLCVRKFFCLTPTCPRKVFAEGISFQQVQSFSKPRSHSTVLSRSLPS